MASSTDPATSLNAAPSTAPAPPRIIDDKTPHCIPFILSLLPSTPTTKPFIIGLNGIQGSGKTTLVSSLAKTLQERGLETLVLSIDDLYLSHTDQVKLAEENPLNPLVQHRGEPGIYMPFTFCVETGVGKWGVGLGIEHCSNS